MEVTSPVTGSRNTKLVEEFDTKKISSLYDQIGIKVDRFFDGMSIVSLYQCNDTGYRFYYPFSIFGDDLFYQDLYTTIPNYYHPDRWEYEFAFSKIPAGSTVLEIGSGAGIFLQRLKTSNCKATGLELNSKVIADSKAKGLQVHAELIESFSEKHPGEYDVVCSFQVLEHVENVKSFVSAAIHALKPEGKLIFSVPNSNPYFLKQDKYHTLNLPPHHSGLWNRTSLENLANYFPLSVDSIKAEPLREHKDWYLTQMKYYADKKPWLANLMKLVPRFIFKNILKVFSTSIEGSYITAIYQKKND